MPWTLSDQILNREQLAKEIFRTCHLKGEFKLRSGLTSPEYFDKYRFEAQPRLLWSIVQHMKNLIPSETQVLAGLEVGGIPIATALSLVTGLPVIFVRKTAKDYGTCRIAEGLESIGGLQVTVIEDVVTTGGQVILSANDLRREGALVKEVMCVIDREQGAGEKLKAADLRVTAVFTAKELRASSP
jgi:orotate phosphoribosyltransferase